MIIMKLLCVCLSIKTIGRGEFMRCDVCGSNETYLKKHEHNYIIKGKKISFVSERRFCKNCNNLVYDLKLDNEASEIAIFKYNEEYGVTKEDIIRLREKFNLSQDLFSKVIGCAKKTLISYEKGKSIPNDSYLIIIKCLLNSPETIKTIINANKEQFTEKEIKKINEKISNVTFEKEEKLDENRNLNEYNGYSKLSKEKVYNMIIYFASETVLKTKLLKEMFYADFVYYRDNCKSITGLEYAKINYGPVPDQYEFILDNCVNEGFIDYKIDYKYENQYECHKISSIKKFDKNVFTNEELKVLKEIKDKFKNFSSSEIKDFSHKEKAFTTPEFGEMISYDYAFDIKSI